MITLRKNTKRYTDNDIQETVFNMLEHGIPDDRDVLETALQSIYMGLIAGKPGKCASNPIQRLANVAKLAKGDVRKYLEYIYSNGETLYASNGHILLSMSAGNMHGHQPEGWYTAKRGKLERASLEDWKAPNYERLFEQCQNEVIENIDLSCVEHVMTYEQLMVAVYVREIDRRFYFSSDYWDMIAEYPQIDIAYAGKDARLMAYDPEWNQRAVLMGVRY